MRAFYTLILVLLAGTAFGQSKLPACGGGDISKWSKCFGEETLNGHHQYKGEFLNGQKHGFGVLDVLHPDFKGDKYVGEFKNGMLNGQGTYYHLADNQFKGDKHVGEYKDNNKNGQGTYLWNIGHKYVGEFKDGASGGQGTLIFLDGRVWLGEWSNWKLNGRGILYSANGSIKESGIYKDDTQVTSQYIDPNSFTRIALGNTTKDTSDNQRSNNSITLDVAKIKCEELGFKPETEGFGKCVLQLTK